MPDPTTTPDTPTGPPVPSTPTPAPSSPSTSSTSATSGPTTNVSVAYPVSEFVSGVDGVPVILSTPTAVPTASLPALRDAAAASHGVNLIEEQS